MELDWKKISLIGLIIGGTIVMGALLYFLLFSPANDQPTPPATNPASGGNLPVAGVGPGGNINEGGPTPGLPTADSTPTLPGLGQPDISVATSTELLISSPTNFLATNTDGSFVYYDAIKQKFFRADGAGNLTELTNQVFKNVSQVYWSTKRDKAVLEYPDGSNIIYDFTSGQQMTLPRHWQEFSFSADDTQIGFKNIALDPENRFLAISKLDGSEARILENIGGVENEFQINWSPNNQMIATVDRITDASRSEVYFIGLNGENFKSMTVNGHDFQGLWSPTGKTMIYSVYNIDNDYKPELWIADAEPNTVGNNRRRLNLETWSNKCTFQDNTTAYCAVPINLPYGSGLEPGVAKNTVDQIYHLDLTTGNKTLIALPDSRSIETIITSPDGQYLLFRDATNQRIYRIDL